MQSEWYDTFLSRISDGLGYDYRTFCEETHCLSADVGAAYDPNYADAYEKRNSSKVNHGVTVMKYTGTGGKSGSSDCSAEFMTAVGKLFDENDVLWQVGELGRVDLGGGGTVAKYLAKRNIDTLDIGVPVLSMHAPFEVTAKLDVYMMYRAAAAFYKF